MSSTIKVTLVRDTVTPDLQRMANQLGDAGRSQVLRAMGAEAIAITQGAFKNASLRPLAWPPLKYRVGMPLIKTQQLVRGIHISELTADYVKISPSVDYAVHHQLGAPKAHIPPRPFFPFTPNGHIVAFAHRRIEEVARAALRRLLGH